MPFDLLPVRPHEPHDDCILVELRLEGVELEDIPSITSTVAAALEKAGAVVVRTFLARSGGRWISVVKGRDAATVAACLSAADIAPEGLWQCAELDPQPPGLFEARSGMPPLAPRMIPETSERPARDGMPDGLDAILRRKIRARVQDPETARKLLPDHPFGTKRVPLENGYYEAYNRSNVELVDLRETPVERVTEEGILTSR